MTAHFVDYQGIVGGDGVTIRGLVVNGSIRDLILVSGAGHFRIEGNFVGSDVTGSRDRSFAFTALGRERGSFAGITVRNSSDGVIGGAPVDVVPPGAAHEKIDGRHESPAFAASVEGDKGVALRIGLDRLHAVVRRPVIENQEFVALFRTRDQVRLIKASYEGLRRANPPEYYRKFPEFVDMEKEIF